MTFSLPVDASAEGWRIDHILFATHIAVVVLSIVALVWLGISLWRDRRGQTVRFTHGTSRREKAVPLGLAAFVFFVVDGYLLVRSHTDLSSSILRVDTALAEADVVRVQVGARQWAWDIRYPGTDGRFDTEDDFYTVSKLVLPAGRAVVFELGSGDVVHSFYLPNFRVKQDAIPGRVLRGWFRPTRLGHYEMACAQHCGVHHYQMGGTVEVVSPAEFSRWQAAMSLDGTRLSREYDRAKREEASYQPTEEFWPELVPSRNWAWPWGVPVQGEGAGE